jgi:two-component system cell cycle response regulator DivK
MAKVLIIDDDTRNIFALSAVLKSRQFECMSAISASEGFNKLSTDDSIGVVLLDMMMPEMDGYETIRLIRGGHHKQLPIVAVTAQAMIGDKEKCLEAGANAYLAKPIDVDQLMILLHRFLR